MTMTHKEALREAAGIYWESPIRERKLEDMDTAIRAYIEARGLALVPRKETEEMRRRGVASFHANSLYGAEDGDARDVYRSMLAAAPDPFEEGE